MSRQVTASTPGKVVLCGEYAVLDGAPAIAMAVDRRASATVIRVGGDQSSVTVTGFSDETSYFRIDNGAVQWGGESRPVKVVDSIWRAQKITDQSALRIDLDTSRFVDEISQQKIGIGSSAAITVALSAALQQTSDLDKLENAVHRAHADLQQGVGSGVDVACCLHGGVLEYRMDGADARPVGWPQGLHFRLIYSGVAASTRTQLSKLKASATKPSRARLAQAAEAMAVAWQRGDADKVIAEFQHYNEILRVFSDDHDLDMFAAGHESILRLAHENKLSYKPCGAGGGDIGIVLGTNQRAVDSFARKVAPAGIALDCRLSDRGLELDTMEQA